MGCKYGILFVVIFKRSGSAPAHDDQSDSRAEDTQVLKDLVTPEGSAKTESADDAKNAENAEETATTVDPVTATEDDKEKTASENSVEVSEEAEDSAAAESASEPLVGEAKITSRTEDSDASVAAVEPERTPEQGEVVEEIEEIEETVELPVDIVPEYPILISIIERLTVALPTAALAVSLAMGHAIGGLVSAAVLLVAILMIAFRDDRSRRRAWRRAIPELPWAEYEASDLIRRLLILQVVAWAAVYLLAIVALLWGPKTGTSALLTWTGVGVFALIVVFFLPGFNTIDAAAHEGEATYEGEARESAEDANVESSVVDSDSTEVSDEAETQVFAAPGDSADSEPSSDK